MISNPGFRRLSSAALALLIMSAPCAGGAQSIRLSDGQPRELAAMATGEQVVLGRRSGPLSFAGREVQLRDFIGVAGYASEIAYLLVLAGEASLGGKQVRPGQMLLLPPYGADAMIERFDAGRFRDAWSSAAAAAAPEAHQALAGVAKDQKFGLFVGRYQRTGFNVATSGTSASREVQRRQAIGAPAVRAIRFSEGATPTELEYRVITSFAEALAKKDAASVAELLDPTPFANEGGAEARLVLARALIAERNWGRIFSSVEVSRSLEPNKWLLAGPGGLSTITLRATPDFAFIAAIQTGESS